MGHPIVFYQKNGRRHKALEPCKCTNLTNFPGIYPQYLLDLIFKTTQIVCRWKIILSMVSGNSWKPKTTKGNVRELCWDICFVFNFVVLNRQSQIGLKGFVLIHMMVSRIYSAAFWQFIHLLWQKSKRTLNLISESSEKGECDDSNWKKSNHVVTVPKLLSDIFGKKKSLFSKHLIFLTTWTLIGITSWKLFAKATIHIRRLVVIS